jgi:prepilin-type N-terminal cleavage/methylation domain-containing protein
MDNLFNRVARRRRRGAQGGFTLIELLVVIAVLAVLATIVIFNVAGVANRGRTSACVTDLKTIQTASDGYYSDTAGYPTTGGAVPGAIVVGDLSPAYIHAAAAADIEANTGAVNLDLNGTATAAKC